MPIMSREEAQRAIDLEGAAPPPSVRLDACRAVVALHDRVAELEAENARLLGWLQRIEGGDNPDDDGDVFILRVRAWDAINGEPVPT